MIRIKIYTGFVESRIPRLRELVPAAKGGITQPTGIEFLLNHVLIEIVIYLLHLVTFLQNIQSDSSALTPGLG